MQKDKCVCAWEEILAHTHRRAGTLARRPAGRLAYRYSEMGKMKGASSTTS